MATSTQDTTAHAATKPLLTTQQVVGGVRTGGGTSDQAVAEAGAAALR